MKKVIYVSIDNTTETYKVLNSEFFMELILIILKKL